MELSKQDIVTLRVKAEEAGVLDSSPPQTAAAMVEDPSTERAFIEPSVGPSEETATRIATAAQTGYSLTRTDLERMLGYNDLVDEFFLARALLAAKPVMRIVFRSISGREMGYATGVMVSPNLILTNHHVFPRKDEAENAVVDANYVNDIFGKPARSFRFRLRSEIYFENCEPLDWALVAVEGASEDGSASLAQFGYHRLIRQTGKVREGEFITLIQHPSGQRRQFAIRENQFIRYHEDFLWYKSDTAPGSSGSPAFNDGFQIVGLHHRGVPEQEGDLFVLADGRRVSSLVGISEEMIKWEANAGVRVSRICDSFDTELPKEHPLTRELFVAMEGGDIMSNPGSESTAPLERDARQAGMGVPELIDGGVSIPFRINLTLDAAGAQKAQPAPTPQSAIAEQRRPTLEPEFTEKVPIIDRDYSTRAGYDENFLGVKVPLPTIKDGTPVSHMDNGEALIPYQNFSVVLNPKRRMAFFTAANVDASQTARQPEQGKNYSRNGLAGFDKEASETWITDNRVPAFHQLPDRFYNKDRKAFDKGHIVQRDSVCWGNSYELVRRANGDTFHVTNCAPQTSVYNQSSRGKDNWGDLENEIMKQAGIEKVCVLAGPVFSESDPDFHGFDDFGAVKIPVPRKYWKIVVAERDGALEAFGFVLEQNLQNVQFEFFVPEGWKKYQIRISKLQSELEPVRLPQEVIDADKFTG